MSQAQIPLETTPADVNARLRAGQKIKLIDVREPSEHTQASVAEAELIPMRTVPARLSDIEAAAADNTIVVMCHRGGRSLQIACWLREKGVGNCQSMSGGIDRWSVEIDPKVPRYF